MRNEHNEGCPRCHRVTVHLVVEWRGCTLKEPMCPVCANEGVQEYIVKSEGKVVT